MIIYYLSKYHSHCFEGNDSYPEPTLGFVDKHFIGRAHADKGFLKTATLLDPFCVIWKFEDEK